MVSSRVLRAALICVTAGAETSVPLVQNSARAEKVAIVNVTVIDGTGAAPVENMMLILDGDKIEDVGRVGSRSIPPNARVHDLSGHVVIPGLIESHTHVRPLAAISQARLHAELDRMLHGGIVTARIMAGDLEVHRRTSRAAEDGSIPSPDLYYAFNVKDSGVAFKVTEDVSDDDIETTVAQAVRGGAGAIKIAAEVEVPAALLRRLVDAALE